MGVEGDCEWLMDGKNEITFGVLVIVMYAVLDFRPNGGCVINCDGVCVHSYCFVYSEFLDFIELDECFTVKKTKFYNCRFWRCNG